MDSAAGYHSGRSLALWVAEIGLRLRAPSQDYGRLLAAAGAAPALPAASMDAEGTFGKSPRGLRRARHARVFSPSSGPASPRAAASTRSVSVWGVLAATSVLLPRTAIHTLSRGSNRMPHRGNFARSFRVSSAGEFSSGIAPIQVAGAVRVPSIRAASLPVYGFAQVSSAACPATGMAEVYYCGASCLCGNNEFSWLTWLNEQLIPMSNDRFSEPDDMCVPFAGRLPAHSTRCPYVRPDHHSGLGRGRQQIAVKDQDA